MHISTFLQQKVLFQPTRLPEEHEFEFDAPFEEHFIDTPERSKLNALFFPTQKTRSKGIVLYFHGNRSNLQRWGAEHRHFTSRGYDFFAMDYRGYGKSPGKSTPRHLYEDAELTLQHILHGYSPEQVVLYGRSLGSAPATWLAAKGRARSLVLETPFDNMRTLFDVYNPIPKLTISPAFDLPNDKYLRQAKLPILILHGTHDRVVPYKSAARLKPLLKPGDRFVTIEGGAHHNLSAFRDFQEQLDAWL